MSASEAQTDHSGLAPTLIPLADAMASVGYSKASGYRFAAQGLLKLVKLGSKTLVEADELERFRIANTRPYVPGRDVIADAGGGQHKTKPPRRKAKTSPQT